MKEADKFADKVLEKQKFSILFVCLGNICRSPLAEGVFSHLVKEKALGDYFEIDSCGTGHWHVGHQPHEDTCRVARENGFSVDHLRARQVSQDDFKKFDLIVAMDRSNLSDLKRMRGSDQANIICLREYDTEPGDLNVPDPYYGGRNGFEQVYEIIRRCSEQLLDELLAKR